MLIRFDRMYKHDGHTYTHRMTAQAALAKHHAAKMQTYYYTGSAKIHTTKEETYYYIGSAKIHTTKEETFL